MRTAFGACVIGALVVVNQLVVSGEEPRIEPVGRESGRMGMRPPREGAQGAGGDISMEQGMLGRFLMHPKAAEELGLTPAQVTTLKEQAEPLRTEMESLRKELEQASVEQAKLLTGGSVEEDALMAAVEKTAAVRLKMAKLAMKQLLLVKRTLSPEQVAKARELMRERLARRGPEGGEAVRKGENMRRHMQEGEGSALPRERPGQEPQRKDAPPRPASPEI